MTQTQPRLLALLIGFLLSLHRFPLPSNALLQSHPRRTPRFKHLRVRQLGGDNSTVSNSASAALGLGGVGLLGSGGLLDGAATTTAESSVRGSEITQISEQSSATTARLETSSTTSIDPALETTTSNPLSDIATTTSPTTSLISTTVSTSSETQTTAPSSVALVTISSNALSTSPTEAAQSTSISSVTLSTESKAGTQVAQLTSSTTSSSPSPSPTVLSSKFSLEQTISTSSPATISSPTFASSSSSSPIADLKSPQSDLSPTETATSSPADSPQATISILPISSPPSNSASNSTSPPPPPPQSSKLPAVPLPAIISISAIAVGAAVLLLAWTILRKHKLGKSEKFNRRLIPPNSAGLAGTGVTGTFWPTEDELRRRRKSAEAMGDGALVRGMSMRSTASRDVFRRGTNYWDGGTAPWPHHRRAAYASTVNSPYSTNAPPYDYDNHPSNGQGLRREISGTARRALQEYGVSPRAY